MISNLLFAQQKVLEKLATCKARELGSCWMLYDKTLEDIIAEMKAVSHHTVQEMTKISRIRTKTTLRKNRAGVRRRMNERLEEIVFSVRDRLIARTLSIYLAFKKSLTWFHLNCNCKWRCTGRKPTLDLKDKGNLRERFSQKYAWALRRLWVSRNDIAVHVPLNELNNKINRWNYLIQWSIQYEVLIHLLQSEHMNYGAGEIG
uniref:Reverse transcriptase n=1 Tax=Steinernema glaseri TaxID=37863 RepID=A0A1I8AHM6_9BILA